MEKIKINNKDYLRFKIGDEFEKFSSRALFSKSNLQELYKGDITFNKMYKNDIVQKNKSNDFLYPFMDSSTLNNHIKGYSKIYNFNSMGIKVSESGDAGKSILITGKHFIGRPSYVLVNNEFANEYFALYFNYLFPQFKQTGVISNLMFNEIKNIIITIPSNHEKISKVIKRVNEYKQLSKQLSKQLKDYKKAILQLSEREIEKHKKSGNHNKYIEFKIGDEFESISGKGSFNKMMKNGLTQKDYDKKAGFIYPFFDSSTSNNHIKGYSKIFNNEGTFIKQSISGAESGKSAFVKGKMFLGDQSYLLESKNDILNEYFGLFFNSYIPNFRQGSAIPNVYFTYYNNKIITIPANHKELSKIIKNINEWEEIINNTTTKMNKYIEGVLQYTIKGVNNE